MKTFQITEKVDNIEIMFITQISMILVLQIYNEDKYET